MDEEIRSLFGQPVEFRLTARLGRHRWQGAIDDLRDFRDSACGWLEKSGWPTTALGRVSLVVWELITNAVIHGRPPADLEVRLLEHTLRIEVADTDPQPPVLVTEPSSSGGYGLHIVQGVSAQWGWKPLPPGKVVWAEVKKP